MSETLSGKVAIVTGASSGIGEACARMLAAEGCRLTLAARSVDKLEALAAELKGEHLGRARRYDRNATDISNMVDRTLARFGTVDIMCANAGIYIPGEFADGDPDEFTRLLTINIDAVLRCAHAVIPDYEGGGRRRYRGHQLHLRLH